MLKIFWLIWILFLISFFFVNIFLWSFQYDVIIHSITSWLSIEDKIIQFKARLLTPQRFFILKISSLSFLILLIIVSIFIQNLFKKIISSCKEIINELLSILKTSKNLIQKLEITQKIIFTLVFSFIFGLKLYEIYQFPLMLDEVFTHTFFVSKGFLVSSSYYPGPNNHIFFSICGNFFYQIFFIFSYEPVIVLRLVSLLSSLFISTLLFVFCLKKLDFLASIHAVLIFNFLSPVFLFSILARGYILQILLLFIAFLAISTLLEKKVNHKFYSFSYVISSALGFYTIPTFLYPFISLNLFCIILIFIKKNLAHLKLLILNNTVIVLLTLLFYSPIILFNGFESLVSNSWVKSMTFFEVWQKTPSYWLEVHNFFWNDYTVLGLFIWIFLFLLFQHQSNLYKLLFVSFFLIPFILILVQKVLPFPRVWTYLSLILVLVWIFLNYNFKSNLVRKVSLYSSTVLILFLFFFKFQMNHKKTDYHTIAQKISHKNLKHAFINADTYAVFLEYELLKTNKKVFIEKSFFDSKTSYDWVILDKKQNNLILKKNYQLYFKNSEVLVFVHKSK